MVTGDTLTLPFIAKDEYGIRIEGVPIHDNDSILYGIIIHKLPIAIILSIFLINSKMKMSATLLFIVVFSFVGLRFNKNFIFEDFRISQKR